MFACSICCIRKPKWKFLEINLFSKRKLPFCPYSFRCIFFSTDKSIHKIINFSFFSSEKLIIFTRKRIYSFRNRNKTLEFEAVSIVSLSCSYSLFNNSVSCLSYKKTFVLGQFHQIKTVVFRKKISFFIQFSFSQK